MKKICVVGCQGVGKSKICETVLDVLLARSSSSLAIYCKNKHYIKTKKISYDSIVKNIIFIPQQFREIIKDIPNFTKQTEEITLATYGKQLYLENLYTAQGKNILCDRSVLDTFVYDRYFNDPFERESLYLKEGETLFFAKSDYMQSLQIYEPIKYHKIKRMNAFFERAFLDLKSYSKIYLIEPSDREIENDGFRMTDKKQQLEIHKLFLEYFKGFDNVEIINQEDAHKEEFIEKVAKEFNV